MKKTKGTKPMKAIKIDSKSRKLSIVTLDPENTLQGMQEAVGGWIERAASIGDMDIYVNEEGLLDESQDNFFTIAGVIHQPFAGNAIVTGFDHATGETVSPFSSEDDREPIKRLEPRIKFWTRHEVATLSQLGAFS